MFGKIITEMVTPFDQDDNISNEALKDLIKHLIRNSSTSLVIGGLAGEGGSLTEIEKHILIEKTVEYANGKLKVITFCGNNSTKRITDFIRKIDHLGSSGYQIMVPYSDQEGIIAHFKKISSCTKKPILIYNHSKLTGVDIEFETIKELSKVNNIVGYIEANDDLEKVKKLKHELHEMKIYIGNDRLLYAGLYNGADGIVSASAQIFGNSIHHVIQLLRTKQYDDAQALFDIYLPKFEALEIKPSPIPFKAALNQLDLNVGDVRLPLVSMNKTLKTDLYKILGV